MILKQISLEEYKNLLNKLERYDILNMPEYLELIKNNKEVRLFAGYEDDKARIFCSVTYTKVKKIFKLANVNWGPLFLTEENKEELLKNFIKCLNQFHKRDLRTLSIRIVPSIEKSRYDNFEKVEDYDFAKKAVDILNSLGYIRIPYEYYEENGVKLGLFCDSFYTRVIDKDNFKDLLKSFNVSSLRIAPVKAYGLKVEELSSKQFDMFKNFVDDTYSKKGLHSNPYPSWIDKASDYFGDKVKFLGCYIDVEETIRNLTELINDYDIKIKKYMEQLESNPNAKKANNMLRECSELKEANLKRINEINKIKEITTDNRVYLYAAFYVIAKNEIFYVSAGQNQKFADLLPGKSIYPMQEYMMTYAIENNKKYYNFYGTTSEYGPEAVDYGVQSFKKNFNGNIEKYIGSFQNICSPLAKVLLPHYNLIFK